MWSWSRAVLTRTLGRVKPGSTLTEGLNRLRATIRRDGAQQSGLSSLTELSFVNAAGDALVTVALAGSLFFAVPTGEARSKVALYLLITMVPFALLAPVVGPLLDRVAYGRRTALAAICLGRCLLAWQLAGALDGLAVYPLALGLLVLSRAFGVARSAVVPRVTPPEMTLVKVNSRISLVNIVAGAVVAPLGLGLANIPFVGYPWVLRVCALIYMAGVLLAFNLPGHVDSAAGERTLRELTGPRRRGNLRTRFAAALGALPVALRATLVLRGLVGFLTFYLAFLLRTNGGNNLWLGALAATAGFGSGIGVLIGGRLGRRRPEGILMLGLLLAASGCLVAAVTYTRFTSLVAALLAMTAGSMAKLALDAIIQRDIVEDTRGSAFARSETALQLGWVTGGAFGLIEMPGTLGFALAAAAVGLALVLQSRALREARRQARERHRSTARETTGAEPPWPGPQAPAQPSAPVADTVPAPAGYATTGYATTDHAVADPTATDPTAVGPPPVSPAGAGAVPTGSMDGWYAPDPRADVPVSWRGPAGGGQWAGGDPDATNPLGHPPVPEPAAAEGPGGAYGPAPQLHHAYQQPYHLDSGQPGQRNGYRQGRQQSHQQEPVQDRPPGPGAGGTPGPGAAGQEQPGVPTPAVPRTLEDPDPPDGSARRGRWRRDRPR
ncbi:MFS transporter [Frankia sp. Mgl5]|uniref:MFS transporter n=1 Tax=Frankia sp. Mgl5 TaxID=2933793 RepID=UPI00200E5960|nr:MFS transporter [Frankia sp. Mgl5]MCK9932977.1 MFS transporter [Frankia sp. Mgl5]